VIDLLARPRIGVVLPAGEESWMFATAARVLPLAVLDRLPRARVSVLVAGAAPPSPSALDCGRPPRRLEAADRTRLDALVVVGPETKVSGRGGAGACPVVRVPGELISVALLAGAAGGEELRSNRVGTLRLLGWLPDDAETAHVVVDGGDADAAISGVAAGAVPVVVSLGGDAAPLPAGWLALPGHAGVDEVIAAVASAQAHTGQHPLLAAIAAGAGVPAPWPPAAAEAAVATLTASLDEAATAALDCWRGRGSPGAIPDPLPARRLATQHAALRVELRALERRLDLATQRAEQAEAETQLILGSRTWRYSERFRTAYHSARGRLRR
jgi:hypothetical protein